MLGFELTVMLVMIVINSVFAAYEIALASVSLARLRGLAEEKRHGAAVAAYMKENMEASLAVVQVGITLVGAIAAAVGGAGAEELLAPKFRDRFGLSEGAAEAFAIATVVMPLTGLTIVFGELIPKVFALRNAERVCLRLSPAMRWFSFSVWPAVWLFEAVTHRVMAWGERRLASGPTSQPELAELQEIRATAALARASRLIGDRAEDIIVGATELHRRRARDIMLPAEHISTLNLDAPLGETLIAAHLDMHTRFPVVERPGDPQSVVGYVNVKDVIAAMRLNPTDPSLRGLVRPLPAFRGDDAVADCLERMMRESTHIALVRDPDGTVVGMISLEDILEELVGDIGDEYDRLPAHVVPSGSSWVCGGGATLNRLAEVAGLDLGGELEGDRARTLADWVEGRLGRPVRGGDVVVDGSYRVAVRKVRRQKVQEAQISRADSVKTAAAP
jgi:putative hemolysin